MQLHRNAKLGLRGRPELVLAIERGMSLKAAAAAFSVSPATAHRSLACLHDRSSRPRRCPRMLPAREQARICAARRRSGWGPRLIAGETGHPHATVWRALRRAGISRLPRIPREQVRRYEWPCPGDLLHMDTKRFSRFSRPGHAVTGIRDRTGAEKRMRVGHEFVHSIVDDHSRLAYSGFVRRTLGSPKRGTFELDGPNRTAFKPFGPASRTTDRELSRGGCGLIRFQRP